MKKLLLMAMVLAFATGTALAAEPSGAKTTTANDKVEATTTKLPGGGTHVAVKKKKVDIDVSDFLGTLPQEKAKELYQTPTELAGFLNQHHRSSPNLTAFVAANAPRTKGYDDAIIGWVLKNKRTVTPPFFLVLAGRYVTDQPAEATRWFVAGGSLSIYEALLCNDRSAQAGAMYPARLSATGLDQSVLRQLLESTSNVDSCENNFRSMRELIAERDDSVQPGWICDHGMNAMTQDTFTLPSKSARMTIADDLTRKSIKSTCGTGKAQGK